jgi:peptide deformylase
MHNLSILTVSLETAHLPASTLRQRALDVPANISPDMLRKLIEEMFVCLYSTGGVGLAAPQVGVGWRLFLAMDRDPNTKPLVLINPTFTDLSDEIVEGREGCLSIPGYVSLKVPRSRVVKVEALNQFLEPVQIEAADFLARVIQHEYDHLDGILYIDRIKLPDDLETVEDAAYLKARSVVNDLFTRPVTSDTSDNL